jgi:hypothetical protein
LTTDAGWVDLLGGIAGGGTYAQLLPHTIDMTLFGPASRVLDLPHLIVVKRAAGTPKDLEAVAELEALLAEINGDS